MSRSIGDQGTTDLMNLLHSGSDSDAVELLNLPPLKKANNKPKKRKHYRMNSNELCSLWNLLKIVLVLTLIGVVALTGAMTYKLTTQMKDLQNKIKHMEVENSNQEIPKEWQAIKVQLQDYNKSLASLRTGDKGLDEVIRNLTAIGAQVESLKTQLKQIKTDLPTSPAKKDTNLDRLKQSLATIGSKVETLEKTQSDFEKNEFNKLSERVRQLEEKSSLISIGVEPSVQPVVVTEEEKAAFRQQLDELRQSAEITNSSIYSRLDEIGKELTAHQTCEFLSAHLKTITQRAEDDIERKLSRFDTLDTAASIPHVAINTSMITNSVKRELIPYLQALVKNSSHSIAPAFNMTVLDAIKSQVKSISTVVLDLQQQMNSSSGETGPGLQAIQTQIDTTNSQLESLNVTVSSIREESDHMMELYVKEKNSIVKLSHLVVGVQRFIDTQHPPPTDKEVGTTQITDTATTETPIASPSTPTDDLIHTTKNEIKRGAESELNKELEDLFQ